MMEDDDDHLWNFASLPPLPMDHLLPSPLPPENTQEELLHPPPPQDSSSSPHQQLLIGQLQVDSAGRGDDTDAAEEIAEDELDEPKPAVYHPGEQEVDDEDAEDGEEPSSKRTKYSGRDSPDVGWGDYDSKSPLEDIASSSQSSTFSTHQSHHLTDFRNLNITFNNNDNYDAIISEFGHSDDDHEDIVNIKIEKLSEDGSSEPENNEMEGNEVDDRYKDIQSPGGSSHQDPIHDSILPTGEDENDLNSPRSSHQELTEDQIPHDDPEDESIPPDVEDMLIVDEVKEDTNVQGHDDVINVADDDDNGDDNNADDNNSDEWDYDSDEIDAMLDEGLKAPKRRKLDREGQGNQEGGKAQTDEKKEEERIIVVNKLMLKGAKQQAIDVLPTGWIRIVHESGMPLYLHRPSRVVTWSRPYLLGNGSARRHKVPLNSIPCMQYKKNKEGETNEQHPKDVSLEKSNTQECQLLENKAVSSNQTSENKENEPISNTEQTEIQNTEKTEISNQSNGASQQNAAEMEDGELVEATEGQSGDPSSTNASAGGDGSTGATNKAKPLQPREIAQLINIRKDEDVALEDFQQYLQRLFEFEMMSYKKFRSWTTRRILQKREKEKEKKKERPQLPTQPTLITCRVPTPPGSDGKKKGKKDFVINNMNKSPVSILHEYAQKILKNIPTYSYSLSNNANTPFECCVEIDGSKYGRGQAKSKRLAKVEAAQATLKLLIPDLERLTKDDKGMQKNLEYFDHVAIDDPRVFDLCDKTGLLSPWQLLQEYHQRNYGMTNMEIQFNVKINKYQKSEYTMTYGPHVATGVCRNKKTGKQEGAQKMLALLHPHLSNWGAIIKLYGTLGISTMNLRKKELKQSVVALQGKASHKPNEHIFNKLKSEMKKLYLKSTEQELKQSVVALQGKASHKPNEHILNKLKSEMKRLYLKSTEQNTSEETTESQQSISAS